MVVHAKQYRLMMKSPYAGHVWYFFMPQVTFNGPFDAAFVLLGRSRGIMEAGASPTKCDRTWGTYDQHASRHQTLYLMPLRLSLPFFRKH